VEKPFSAYRGDGPYVFVCYAHEDSEAVFREIAWLNDYGVNVWYDEGISPGHEWSDELARAIQGCTKVFYVVTPSSVASEHCRRELNFAQEEGREVVAIHLEATEVPAGLRLVLNNRQAILKHELTEEEFHKRLIRVVQGQGGDSPAAPPTSTTPEAKPRSSRALLVGAIALILVAAAAWWLFARESAPEYDEPASVAETPAPAPDVLPNSIAVLPFESLSPDPNNAFFAAGIHEEILSQLSRIKDISVIARSSVMQYAGQSKPISEIARELRVEKVMEGSVRYAGDRVRIAAQLIDPETGTQLWSRVFEENLEDIFGIQLAIATQIANALQADLSIGEQQVLAARTTQSPEAYARYLYAMSRMGNFSAMGPIHTALEQAIEIDPEFAPAYAFNAWIYGLEGFFPQFNVASYGPESVRKSLELAVEYAERALELDPDQAFAHLQLGALNLSREHLDRALELTPNDYRVLSSVGSLRIQFWEELDGIELIARSVEVNPADAANVWFFRNNLFLIQRWTEAVRQAKNVTQIAPEAAFGHAHLAKVSAIAGDADLARDSASIAESLDPDPFTARDIARAYGLIGDREGAIRVFETAMDQGGGITEDPYWQYEMHVAIGDLDSAMEFLDEMIEGGFPPRGINDLARWSDHPIFDEVRDHPRFSALVERARQIDIRPSD
jgi:TolB-like protein